MRSVVAVVNLLLLVGVTLARPSRGPGRGDGGTRDTPLSKLSVTEQTALAQQVEKMVDEANLPCVNEAKVTLGQAALVTALRITMEESMWVLLGALEGVETVLPQDLELVTDGVGEEMEGVLTSPLIDDMETPRFQGLYKAVELLDRVNNRPTDRMLQGSARRLVALAKDNCDKLLTKEDAVTIISDISNSITPEKVNTLKTAIISRLSTLLPSAALDTLRPHLVSTLDTAVEQLRIVVSVGELLIGGATPTLLPALETLISALASKQPLIEPIMMSAPDHMNPFNDLSPTASCFKQRATALNLVALTVAYGVDQALLRDVLINHLPAIPGVDMMDAAHKIAEAIEMEATAVDTLAEQTLVNTPLKVPFLALRKNLPLQDVTFFMSEKLPMVAMAIRRMIDNNRWICTMDTAPITDRLISILDQVKTKYTHSAFEETVRIVLKTAYTDQTLAEQALNKIKEPLASYAEDHAETVAEFSEHLGKGELVMGILRDMLEDLEESVEEDSSEETVEEEDSSEETNEIGMRTVAGAEINSAETSLESNEALTGKKPGHGPGSRKPKFAGFKMGFRPPTTTPEPISETLIKRIEEALAAAENTATTEEDSAETSLEPNKDVAGKKPKGKPRNGKPKFAGFKMGLRPPTTTPEPISETIIKRIEEALAAVAADKNTASTEDSAKTSLQSNEDVAGKKPKSKPGNGKPKIAGLKMGLRPPMTTPEPISETVIKRLEEALATAEEKATETSTDFLTGKKPKSGPGKSKLTGLHIGRRPPPTTTPTPANEVIKRLEALIATNGIPAKADNKPVGPHPGPHPHAEKPTTTPEPASEIIKRLEALIATNTKPAKVEHAGPHVRPHYHGEKPTTTPEPAVRRQETNAELEPLRPPSSTDTCCPQKTLALNIVMLSLLSGVDQMMMRSMLSSFLPTPTRTPLPTVLQTLATELEPEAEAMVNFVRLKDLAGTKLDSVVSEFHKVLPSKPLDYLLSADLETALNAIRTEIDSNPALCRVDVKTVTDRLVTLFTQSKEKYVTVSFRSALENGLSQFYTASEVLPVLPKVLEIFEGYREEHEEIINALIPALQKGELITKILDPVMEDVAELLEAQRH